MNLIYKIQFYNFWQCSSGLSAGNDVSDLVIKDEELLPYIPGKTMKGLFREAAEFFRTVVSNKSWSEFIITHFGKSAIVNNDQKRDLNKRKQGTARFSNAELSHEVKRYLKQEKESIQDILYRRIASTAIDQNGQAKAHSLRKTEVTIPLPLFGKIENCSDGAMMLKCLQWVKRLGSKRNRGYGRCDIQIIKEKAE